PLFALGLGTSDAGARGRRTRDEMRDRSPSLLPGGLARSVNAPDEPSSDEALLLEYARSRDPRAVDAILRRHWESAVRIGLRALGDPAAAEDAAQEAFVKLV